MEFNWQGKNYKLYVSKIPYYKETIPKLIKKENCKEMPTHKHQCHLRNQIEELCSVILLQENLVNIQTQIKNQDDPSQPNIELPRKMVQEKRNHPQHPNLKMLQ